MELRNITTFVKAAEVQSFTRAAEQLGYSQSAVTVQIRQLEEELEVRLFERIGKKVRLTEEGNRFWESALEILKRIDGVKADLHPSDKMSGALRVATAESLLCSILAPVLPRFAAETAGGSGHSEVEVCVRTGTIDRLFEMVRQNDADLLFFLDKKTRMPEWEPVFERREPIVFVAGAENPIAREKHISVDRVMQEAFLLTEKGVSYRYDLEQELIGRGVELHPFLETGNTELIVNLVQQNLGVSFLPEYTVKEQVAKGTIAVLDVDFPPVEMWSQMVYHKNKWLTPQMKLFIRLVKEHLMPDDI